MAGKSAASMPATWAVVIELTCAAVRAANCPDANFAIWVGVSAANWPVDPDVNAAMWVLVKPTIALVPIAAT